MTTPRDDDDSGDGTEAGDDHGGGDHGSDDRSGKG